MPHPSFVNLIGIHQVFTYFCLEKDLTFLKIVHLQNHEPLSSKCNFIKYHNNNHDSLW
jgi:hypothetical protein